MVVQYALSASILAASSSLAVAGGIACPSADGAGRPLRVGATATLYFGDPAKKGSQAPDRLDGAVNVFKLPQGGAGYYIVCNYRDGHLGAPISVPASAKEGQHNATSFTCR